MAVTMKRGAYSGPWNGVTAFSPAAGKTWLMESLSYRITDPSVALSLEITHRDSAGTNVAVLTSNAAPAVQAEASREPKWNGVVLEPSDQIRLSGTVLGLENLELVISYIEIS
jgi:hypothetical protein